MPSCTRSCQTALPSILAHLLLLAALLLVGLRAHASETPIDPPQRTVGLDEHGFPEMNLEGLVHTRTAHFQAWAVPEAQGGMENIVQEQAEGLRHAMFQRLGLEDSQPIRVLFLPDLNDYFRRRGQPARAPEWAVGLAIPGEDTILVKWGRTEAGPWVALEPTFVHELAHMALDRAVGDGGTHVDGSEQRAWAGAKPQQRRIPRWLHEGFAIQQAGEWTLERGTVLMQAGLRGRIIPLRDLHRGFPAEGFDVELAYAQSYHFVSHLQDRYGKQALAPLLKHMRQGDDFEVAFAKAYNQSFSTVEGEWRERLNVAYTWIPIITGSSTVWFLGGLVFVLAWRRKRALREARMAAMDAEERTRPLSAPMPPLPGLGLTSQHVRPQPHELDGTELDHHDWASSWAPLPPRSDMPDELELPRTPDGHTIH